MVFSFFHPGISVQWFVGDNQVTRLCQDYAKAGLSKGFGASGSISGHQTILKDPLSFSTSKKQIRGPQGALIPARSPLTLL